MHALPLLALALTLGEIQDALAGLPSHKDAHHCYSAASHYVSDLERYFERAETLGEKIRIMEVLCEARPLLNWWTCADGATNPACDLRWRLEYARDARWLHDWHHYGWPPAVPFWRLPHR